MKTSFRYQRAALDCDMKSTRSHKHGQPNSHWRNTWTVPRTLMFSTFPLSYTPSPTRSTNYVKKETRHHPHITPQIPQNLILMQRIKVTTCLTHHFFFRDLPEDSASHTEKPQRGTSTRILDEREGSTSLQKHSSKVMLEQLMFCHTLDGVNLNLVYMAGRRLYQRLSYVQGKSSPFSCRRKSDVKFVT